MNGKSAFLEVLKKKVLGIKKHKSIKNTFAFLDEWLHICPLDWVDFVLFAVHVQNHALDGFIICLDDDETSLGMDILKEKKLNMYIASIKPDGSGPNIIWQVIAFPNNEDIVVFVGGESLRKYCDERNIYYESFIDSKGNLMSGSQFRYLKEENEDFRKPMEEKDVAFESMD